MGEARQISDVIDISALLGETRWEQKGRIRNAVKEQRLEGWCCRGAALVDIYKRNVDSWSTMACVLGLVSDWGQGHWCLDDIELCPSHKRVFDGSSPDEKLARAFHAMKTTGTVYRMSECRWRNDE